MFYVLLICIHTCLHTVIFLYLMSENFSFLCFKKIKPFFSSHPQFYSFNSFICIIDLFSVKFDPSCYVMQFITKIHHTWRMDEWVTESYALRIKQQHKPSRYCVNHTTTHNNSSSIIERVKKCWKSFASIFQKKSFSLSHSLQLNNHYRYVMLVEERKKILRVCYNSYFIITCYIYMTYFFLGSLMVPKAFQ